ncbi:PAS domain-containing protein [Solitalea koreensis]|uniref:histidine kinase n=1 Tax=Solitalea koreensis TaxID=543615 RepID=A0A521E549_9SPHI|nr:PAS domain-containing protein [Solitalea koreensis]SMO79074.1 PAS domain S-box-containing protein [Solitalea koreensis]
MSNFFSLPDKEKDFQRYMAYMLTIIWSVVTGLIVAAGFYFLPQAWLRWLTFLSLSIFIAVFNISLNRFGYTRLASWSFIIMLWLYITIPNYSAGGIFAPGIMSQMSVILTAGFLLGWRGGLAIGLLTMGVDFWMAYMQLIGQLPAPSVIHNPITRWIGAVIPFGTILALQYYATNHLRTGLLAMQREMLKREEAEKVKDKTLYDLGERVKELKTLYAISRILQDEDTPPKKLFREIAEVLPAGWQYPDITAARVWIAETEYVTHNYEPSEYSQSAEMKTTNGTKVGIEVVYLQPMAELDEGPFLQEERSLINMLVEMLKIDLERRERSAELKDYKYALDIASGVSITGADDTFTFVNDNFCKASKYSPEELLSQNWSITDSGIHSPEYFASLHIAMQNGKPYRGEFCNKAKDGTLYWVDTSVIPFLDDDGNVYQHLSINYDITERKAAEEKIKQSERLIKKITSQVPGNTYMFEIEESGYTKILFMNRGTDTFNHPYNLEDLSEQPEKLREIFHEDDKAKFNDAMKEAYRTQSIISCQYRIIVDGHIRWRWMQAVPEKDKNGKVIWYGATSDITPLVDYIASIEQIIFDIGHVLRRPISSMMGMTNLINDNALSETEIKEISSKLHLIAEEMDKFITELNTVYLQKRQLTQFNIDISSLIDKRNSLFN